MLLWQKRLSYLFFCCILYEWNLRKRKKKKKKVTMYWYKWWYGLKNVSGVLRSLEVASKKGSNPLNWHNFEYSLVCGALTQKNFICAYKRPRTEKWLTKQSAGNNTMERAGCLPQCCDRKTNGQIKRCNDRRVKGVQKLCNTVLHFSFTDTSNWLGKKRKNAADQNVPALTSEKVSV